ncbi:MAG: glycosyltransferase [Bacilli bacterium]|nr:glycosyltransferase [Bacilli bacterium]
MTKVSNKKVIAIVVTYNRKELLKECINALLTQDYKNCEILIVDNASIDGTKEYITKELKNKKVHYTNTGANIGGAGGFNYGMKEAYKIGCDFMWLMDDDTIVRNDSLSKLIEADKKIKGDYGYLSSVALWKDLTLCKMNIQKTYNKYYSNDTTLVETYMSTFVSMLIKKEVVEEIGLPIKDFFIWGDDVEYSNRISKKYKNYVVKESIVIHKTKDNVGSNIALDDNRIDRYKYAYRNEVYVARMNGLKYKIRQFLKVNFHIIKVLFQSKKDKIKKCKIIIKSSLDGIKFNPKIEYVPEIKRVLELFGEPFSNGGQESFIMNIYRNLDLSKVKLDFYTPYYCDNEKYKNEIINSGGFLYAGNGKFNSMFRKKIFKKKVRKFLREYKNKYDVIHIHSGSIFSLAIGAKIAKKYGIKKIIVHSHSAGYNNIKHTISKILFSKFFYKYPTDLWACSKIAAYWKYPNKMIDSNKVKIIKNTIDVDKYLYNSRLRNEQRKELKISTNDVVIGTIGRMSAEKNQLFLLDIMKEINEKNNNYYLLIIGDGMLKNEIENKIKKENIKNVILLGKRSNVNELLNIMDVFVLPSIYEGFPVTAIEAQANGLPCIFSDKITEECKINDNVFFLPINEKNDWINLITKINIRVRNNKNINMLQYDTKKYAKHIEKEYLRNDENDTAV